MDIPLFFEYLVNIILLYPPNNPKNKTMLDDLVQNFGQLNRRRNQILVDRRKAVAKTAGIAVAIGAGLLYVVLSRKRIIRRFISPLYGQTIQIVTNPEECQKVVSTLRNHCQELSVLGFDCEWVHYGGPDGRRPVALLQLSSHHGLCVLIRLSKLWHIPQALSDLLWDPNILKVGIEPIEDAKKLQNDYNLKVNRTLDLRFMAEKVGLSGGLARLAEESLGLKMNKGRYISSSDWEAYELTDWQIKYAANDAHVAIELFRTYAEQIVPRSYWTNRQKWLIQVIHEFADYFNRRFG